MLRFGFKKIGAFQYFGTLGAPKPGEASILLRFGFKEIEASQYFGTLGAPKPGEASILFRFGFKKVEASQYFGTLGAPKPGEASIFLGFKCKNAGRPQNTLMTQSFGGLGRPALNTKRLRPLSILGLWELQNTERPQSFRGSILKKIEASHHFGTVRAPKH